VIKVLRRALQLVLGRTRRSSDRKPTEQPAERLEAAKRRLKQTIPPPED
jgi:hypothetical protein